MSLAARATQQPTRPIHGTPCSIGVIEEALAGDPNEAAALNAILYELGWDAGQVYEALVAEGHKPARQSINRHRGRKCRCFKDAA